MFNIVLGQLVVVFALFQSRIYNTPEIRQTFRRNFASKFCGQKNTPEES